MADARSTPVDKRKPAVFILTLRPGSEEITAPILWGLEEEGIPAELQEVPRGPVETLAKQAADGSPLNVGIGVDAAEGDVVLHHRDLPTGRPLFSLGAEEMKPTCLRRLGLNAARLVKGDPLVFSEEAVADSGAHDQTGYGHHDVAGPAGEKTDDLHALIVRVVTELLQDT